MNTDLVGLLAFLATMAITGIAAWGHGYNTGYGRRQMDEWHDENDRKRERWKRKALTKPDQPVS